MTNKSKLTDITPIKYACELSASCPAVFKSDSDSYVIIGQICNSEEPSLKGRVGAGEMAIEISADLLEKAIKRPSYPLVKG